MSPFTIETCFSDCGAGFYREVEYNGVRFATIRALRPLDADLLHGYLSDVRFEDGAPRFEINRPNELMLARVVLSLGGDMRGCSWKVGREGWELPDAVTIENVNRLRPDLLKALTVAIDQFEADYQNHCEGLKKKSAKP